MGRVVDERFEGEVRAEEGGGANMGWQNNLYAYCGATYKTFVN